ncbi:MAG: hypothetical protein AABW59_00830 [archaeon]
MSRQKTLGLKLEYTPNFSDSRLLIANAYAVIDEPSKDLITSPKIRDTLVKHGFWGGQHFSKFILSYDHHTRDLTFIAYYPYPDTTKEKFPTKKIGLASAMEARIIQKAREYFPNMTHITHAQASRYRIAQLISRGHTHEELDRIELERFVRLLRRKRVKDKWEARNLKKQVRHKHP